MSSFPRARLTAVLSVVLASVASAQEAKSPPLARELAAALDAAKLTSVAAKDPAQPDRYVAALYFPGSQLLVVSARYSAPLILNAKLATKDYRDIYIDLNAASVAGSKIFVMDQTCDGLVAKPGDNAPDTWEEGTKTTVFDGDWKKAKISEADYTRAFATADDRYAKMLSMLAAQAKKAKAGS